MQIIKTVFLAGNDVIDSFKKYYDPNAFELTAVYNGLSHEHASRAESVSGDAVIVDTTTVPQDTINKLISLLNANRGFIVIVPDIKTGFEYLSRGAADMIVKPVSLNARDTESFIYSLCTKIKMSGKQGAEIHRREYKYTGQGISDKIIAIGSSTGGTEIILEIIKNFPKNCPPVVIAQHMPPVFTKLYAQRLDGLCSMSVWEARNGDVLRPGLALIAPGDYQMRVIEKNNSYIVETVSGEKVNGHAPSVDVLFYSVAKAAGKKAVGVILTGMGGDGANGLLEMRKRGAITLGQDEQSSVVYGMPKVAYEIGAVMRQVNMNDMAAAILKSL